MTFTHQLLLDLVTYLLRAVVYNCAMICILIKAVRILTITQTALFSEVIVVA